MALSFECVHCSENITSQFLKIGEEIKCVACNGRSIIPENADTISDSKAASQKAKATSNIKVKKNTKKDISSISQSENRTNQTDNDLIGLTTYQFLIGMLMLVYSGYAIYTFNKLSGYLTIEAVLPLAVNYIIILVICLSIMKIISFLNNQSKMNE